MRENTSASEIPTGVMKKLRSLPSSSKPALRSTRCDAMAVFLAEVVDARVARLEHAQPEQTEPGDQCEVEHVGRRARGSEGARQDCSFVSQSFVFCEILSGTSSEQLQELPHTCRLVVAVRVLCR